MGHGFLYKWAIYTMTMLNNQMFTLQVCLRRISIFYMACHRMVHGARCLVILTVLDNLGRPSVLELKSSQMKSSQINRTSVLGRTETAVEMENNIYILPYAPMVLACLPTKLGAF